MWIDVVRSKKFLDSKLERGVWNKIGEAESFSIERIGWIRQKMARDDGAIDGNSGRGENDGIRHESGHEGIVEFFGNVDVQIGQARGVRGESGRSRKKMGQEKIESNQEVGGEKIVERKESSHTRKGGLRIRSFVSANCKTEDVAIQIHENVCQKSQDRLDIETDPGWMRNVKFR